MPDFSPADRDAFARTIAAEAGQNWDGAVAVANVGLNRLASGNYGKTIDAVVRQPGQFEPWQNGRAQAIDPKSQAYQTALAAIDAVTAGRVGDTTQGATHFFSQSGQTALGRQAPAWGRGQPLANVSGQLFFAPEGTVTRKNSVPDLLGSWGSPAKHPETDAASSAASVPDLLGAWGAPANNSPSDALKAVMPPPGIAPPASDIRSIPIPANLFGGDAKPLANAPSDTDVSSFLKGAGTAAIKGVGDIPGAFGNLYGFGNYLANRAESALTGQSMADVEARHQAIDQARTSTPLGAVVNALAPRNVMPTGETFSGPVLAQTGEYTPTTALGRAGMAGVQTAIGAVGPGFGGKNMLAPNVATTNAGIGAFANAVSDATGDPLIGMAASAGLPALSGTSSRVVNALAGSVAPESAALAKTAIDKFGIPLGIGNISESPFVRYASSVMNKLPFSGAGSEIGAQKSAINRAVAQTFGEDATKITPEVMSAARDRIGGMFDEVANKTTIKADPQFQNELQDTLVDAHREIAAAEMKPLHAIFDNVVSKIDANGNIDGATYQALTRSNTPLMRAVSNNDPNVSYWAGRIKDSLDDALVRSAAPEHQEMLSAAKSQWKNLKMVEPLAAKSPTGDISAPLLQQAINSSPYSKNALAYGGGGDLGDIARIGQKFLKDMPSSGTAERLGVMNALRNAAVLPFAATGAHVLAPGMIPEFSPSQLAVAGASIPASLALGRVVGSVLRSPARAADVVDRSLNIPASRNALTQRLYGSVLPTLLNRTPRNALAPQF